jgi:putative two-component system response regulator
MNTVEQEILNAKILVVDDNPTNVALLEGLLEEDGYTHIYATTDSREVCALHLEHCFDLILLDIRMPHLDGIQVMTKLKEIIDGDYIPVLVLTAQIDIDTRRRALEQGAKDFLTKPFDDWEVLHRIHNILETRVYFNRQRHRADSLDQEVRKRTREVRDTQLEIIRRLGRAAEYKDNETGMHVIRMSKSCQLLARAIGLSEDHAEMLLYASPMHDIGKIGIPDYILLKPGKLNEAEWEVMKQHAKIGSDIVGGHDSELLHMASVIALTHHEKWNGSGYPNQLKGEGIPLEGRITALCDVFDALTSERPYKKAWPVAQAIDYINAESGKHFDPRLTTAFNRILPDILTLRKYYADTPETEVLNFTQNSC